MSVTGHKSVQSLSVYQRVSDEEKIQMGESLGLNLVPTSAPSMTANTAPTNNTVSADTESVLYEVQSMKHDVVEHLFSDFNQQENQMSILRPIFTVNIANLNVNMKLGAITHEIVISIDIVIFICYLLYIYCNFLFTC